MSTPRERRKRLGFRGEEVACAYLVRQGFSIVDRNWHAGHLELDVVVRIGDAARAVEVKTRFPSESFDVADLISPQQERRLVEAADAYARLHDWVGSMQIDVLLVVMGTGGGYSVEYFPDAIAPSF